MSARTIAASATRRQQWAIAIAAAMTIAFAVMMSVVTISREPTTGAGAANLQALLPYWIGGAALWTALTMAVHALNRNAVEPAPPPSRVLRAPMIILVVACVARILVVVAHDGSLSDDLWRYLFDGRTLATGHNPYLVAPIAIDAATPRFEDEAELVARINNPELVTIYLPTSQWSFAAFTFATAPLSQEIDSSARLWRLTLSAVDLIAIAILLVLLARRGRNPWWAIAYAWHPLVISEIAGSGHQDIIGVAIMLGVLAIADRRRAAPQRWSPLLAMAAAVKPVTLPVAAGLLRHERGSQWLRAMIAGAAVSALLYLSLGLWPGSDAARHLLATVDRFVHHWAFQGAIYQPLLALGFGLGTARLLCLSLLAAVASIFWIAQVDAFKTIRVFLFAAVLCSPAAHPWYLLWALVLLPLSPSPALWVASLSLSWGYVVLGDVQNWTVPVWAWGLTYLPIALALSFDCLRRIQRARSCA